MMSCTKLDYLRARKRTADLLIRSLCSAFIALFTKHVDSANLQLCTWASAEIFPGGAKSTFCLFFSCCRRCKANRLSQNALPFLNTTKRMPDVTAKVAKMLFIGSNASFSLIYFFSHRIKLRGLLLSVVTASRHYLPRVLENFGRQTLCDMHVIVLITQI